MLQQSASNLSRNYSYLIPSDNTNSFTINNRAQYKWCWCSTYGFSRTSQLRWLSQAQYRSHNVPIIQTHMENSSMFGVMIIHTNVKHLACLYGSLTVWSPNLKAAVTDLNYLCILDQRTKCIYLPDWTMCLCHYIVHIELLHICKYLIQFQHHRLLKTSYKYTKLLV